MHFKNKKITSTVKLSYPILLSYITACQGFSHSNEMDDNSNKDNASSRSASVESRPKGLFESSAIEICKTSIDKAISNLYDESKEKRLVSLEDVFKKVEQEIEDSKNKKELPKLLADRVDPLRNSSN